MKILSVAVFIFICISFLPGQLLAQEGAAPSSLAGNDDLVRKMEQITRDNLSSFKLPDGSNVSEETPEDRQKPIIPFYDAKEVVNRGILTASAVHCGMDGIEKSFAPFMRKQRASGQFTDRQMAYIGGLHGVTQGVFENALKKKGACAPESKAQIQNMLSGVN
jgi:hypothetical protein